MISFHIFFYSDNFVCENCRSKCRVKIKAVPVLIMKTYNGVEILVCSFLSLALDGDERSAVAYPGILFGLGGFNKFSWGQRTERSGIWGQ